VSEDRQLVGKWLVLLFLLQPVWLMPAEEARPLSASDQETLAVASRSLDEGDYQGALRILLPLKNRTNDSAAYHGLVGFAHAKLSEPIAAIESLQKALQLDPNNENYYLDLAQVLGEYNAHNAAIELLKWAVSAHPKSARLRIGLALACMPAGLMEEARVAAESAISLEPALETGYTTLAMVLEDDRDWRSLLSTARQLQKVNGQNYLGWHYDALAQMGLLEEEESSSAPPVVSAFRRAIELNPAFPLAHFHLGKLYLQQGDYTASIRELNRVVELKPDYAQAHFLLGKAFGQAGELERSQEHLKIHHKLVVAKQSVRRPRLEVTINKPK
jgi:tetratricopeptide (TPR) repeat protein